MKHRNEILYCRKPVSEVYSEAGFRISAGKFALYYFTFDRAASSATMVTSG